MKTIALLLMFCSPCFAQEAMLSSMKAGQPPFDGVWQGKDWKRDGYIIVAYAKPVTVKTDMESGEKVISVNAPAEVKSCVQIDDGDCVESDYFKVTITDSKD
jgi:hypothetical protein